MRIVVTGATGTIGRALVSALARRDEEIVALSRDADRARHLLSEPGVEVHRWTSPSSQSPPADALAGADAVVNLVGEPISQRWTPAVRAVIRGSRVLATQNLVAALRALPDGRRPGVLVSQSATGYYGPRDDTPLDERAPAGSDFLAGVVVQWEAAATAAEDAMRVLCTRTGVVLAAHGGALAKMLPFFRLGLGGPVGGGRQWVPWVHVDDVAGALLACVDDGALSGSVNVVAPQPATNRELSRALGGALHRPAVLPVPALALKSLYGEMAGLVLTGQRVVPRRLLEAGYEFRWPELRAALADVLGHDREGA